MSINLQFHNLEMYNFMSFATATIDFNQNGFIKVIGQNLSADNSISNGSGKSSIWEAIMWCVTGDTIRGTSNVVRFDCDDGTYVKLSFSYNGDEYVLIRSKDHSKLKTGLMIEINGKDCSGKGIRDS